MANVLQIAVALEAVDRVTSVVDKVVGKTTRALERLGRVSEHIKEHSIFGEVLNANLLANGIERMAEGMGEFVKESFNAAVHMDAMTEGLTAVMGSATKAHAEIYKLIDVAKLPGMGIEAALEGSLHLQAGGLSADLSRKFMKGMGMALATVGGGKVAMEGVLQAAGRMLGKGKVDAIHINEMAIRIPSLRNIMKQTFGTADTAKIQKSGLTIEQFFTRISAALVKQRTTSKDSILNQVDNLTDGFEFLKAAAGEAMMVFAKPVISYLADEFYNLSDRIHNAIPKIEAFAHNAKVWLKDNPWLINGLKQLWSVVVNVGKSIFNLGAALLGAGRKGGNAKVTFQDFVKVASRIGETVARVIDRITKWVQENPKATQTILKIAGALVLFGGPALRVLLLLAKLGKGVLTAGKWLLMIGPKFATAAKYAMELVQAFRAFGVGETLLAWFPRLGAVITALSGPIGWIIGALTAIAAIGILVVLNWTKVKKFFVGLFNFLIGDSPFAKVLQFIFPLIGVTKVLVKNWDKVKSWFSDFKQWFIRLWRDIVNMPEMQAVIKAVHWVGGELGAAGRWIGNEATDFWKWGTTDPNALRPAPRAMSAPGGLLPMPILPALGGAGAHSTVHVQLDGLPKGTRVKTNLAPGHTVGMGHTNASLLDP
jgi:tape measure domain-containing protein